MKALDANIVLRLILDDDPHQTKLAEEVVRERCWLSLTVILEIAWVLGSRYRLRRDQVAALLRGIAVYDTVELEAHDAVMWCIDRYAIGGDIADLLHLAAARSAEGFVTFDAGIAKAAGRAPPVAIETLG